MAQVHSFSRGGFVAHRLSVPGSALRFSAWFSADGVMTDAEGIDRAGRSRPVKVNGPQWRELMRAGRVYRPAA